MENILCEHWGLFSETFPTSGMMRDGKLFPLPLLAHRTDVNAYSYLPTPVAQDSSGAMTIANRRLGGYGPALRDIADLMPTPNTMDMLPARTGEARERQLKRGDPNGKPRASSGNLRKTVVNDLLPTTMASMKGASKNEIAKGNPKGRLEVEIFLTDTWGKFAPAIHQWETITNNPAPPPTIPDGRDGQARLNPQFAEWMMGLPPGWVTDCEITRNEQLKACGNGVVPQQATLAITRLLQGITL